MHKPCSGAWSLEMRQLVWRDVELQLALPVVAWTAHLHQHTALCYAQVACSPPWVCVHGLGACAACTWGEIHKRLKVVDVELHVALRGRGRQVGLKRERRAHAVHVVGARRRQVCARAAHARLWEGAWSRAGRHRRMLGDAVLDARCNITAQREDTRIGTCVTARWPHLLLTNKPCRRGGETQMPINITLQMPLMQGFWGAPASSPHMSSL